MYLNFQVPMQYYSLQHWTLLSTPDTPTIEVLSPLSITVFLWWRDLHNSVDLWAMMCRITQVRQAIEKSSGKTWSTGGGNGQSLYYFCNDNTWTVVVQLLSRVQLFETPWTAACQASQYLLEFAQIHVHWVDDANRIKQIGNSCIILFMQSSMQRSI